MLDLISSLRVTRPSNILVAIDGPRLNCDAEKRLVKLTQETVAQIDWPAKIETLFRNDNLGIRKAIPDAVSWAISKYGKVVVIEDDVVVGPQFINFASTMLDVFAGEPKIGQINGYNIAPVSAITDSTMDIRFSKYTSSYAWATWDRAWSDYDDSMEWATNCTIGELQELYLSLSGAMVWRTHFQDAASGAVDTWAYRWLATLWAKKRICVSPNRNLIEYRGFEGGTHTKAKVSWTPLPISEIDLSKCRNVIVPDSLVFKTDKWYSSNVYKETWHGLVYVVSASYVLRIINLAFPRFRNRFRRRKI